MNATGVAKLSPVEVRRQDLSRDGIDGDQVARCIAEIPTVETLEALADALPRPRRFGTAAHADAVATWADALAATTGTVARRLGPQVAWRPGEFELVARTGTTAVRLQAWPVEGSGEAALAEVAVVDLDAGGSVQNKVGLVDVRFEDDLALRFANHANVDPLSFESFFDVYWTTARASAAALLMILPDEAPTGAPTFPAVPSLDPRMPAAFVSSDTGAWLRDRLPEVQLDATFRPTGRTRPRRGRRHRGRRGRPRLTIIPSLRDRAGVRA